MRETNAAQPAPKYDESVCPHVLFDVFPMFCVLLLHALCRILSLAPLHDGKGGGGGWERGGGGVEKEREAMM